MTTTTQGRAKQGASQKPFAVMDCFTGKIVATYNTRRAAVAKADALDLAYGAVRYSPVITATKQFATRFPVRITA